MNKWPSCRHILIKTTRCDSQFLSCLMFMFTNETKQTKLNKRDRTEFKKEDWRKVIIIKYLKKRDIEFRSSRAMNTNEEQTKTSNFKPWPVCFCFCYRFFFLFFRFRLLLNLTLKLWLRVNCWLAFFSILIWMFVFRKHNQNWFIFDRIEYINVFCFLLFIRSFVFQ